MHDSYAAQKEYLSKKKQLRVWMDADKYDNFKALASGNNESIYSLINKFVDDYLSSAGESESH